jgi:hypothetical protein
MISLPGDWLVPANETSSMGFSVSDDLTPSERLVVNVRSSNPGLVTAATGSSPLSAFAASSVVGGGRLPPWCPMHRPFPAGAPI